MLRRNPNEAMIKRLLGPLQERCNRHCLPAGWAPGKGALILHFTSNGTFNYFPSYQQKTNSLTKNNENNRDFLNEPLRT